MYESVARMYGIPLKCLFQSNSDRRKSREHKKMPRYCYLRWAACIVSYGLLCNMFWPIFNRLQIIFWTQKQCTCNRTHDVSMLEWHIFETNRNIFFLGYMQFSSAIQTLDKTMSSCSAILNNIQLNFRFISKNVKSRTTQHMVRRNGNMHKNNICTFHSTHTTYMHNHRHSCDFMVEQIRTDEAIRSIE